ncbi:dihydrolipoamide acetyltransferase family protein [Paenibacillus sp. YN15]|uniref:dihydrolipoamide acetyltransferase family protein n=1 Tax=Paenibacillus sp. YN15 TaxID=1742774 RepID=UPI000DCDFA7E|nr:dihydrolipoamide acetyltransferase family protein [Paenibacillus sp. YN15]RAV00926.1 dienelactone hydrolase [Paenibacillus sp. YN15]
MALFDYRFPELGEGLHEGEIVKWHIKAGDKLEEDQVMMEVQNDKAVVEVPAPVSGKVVEVKVAEGTVAHVGDVVAVFEVEGEAVASASGDAAAEPAPPAAAPVPAADGQGGAVPPAAASAAAAATAPAQDRRQVLATPGVRKFAREQGVDLARLQGSGKNGRITREDVTAAASGGVQAAAPVSAQEQAAPVEAAPAAQTAAATASTAPATADAAEERVPLKGVRKIIAQAMAKSVYTAPHVTVMDEVDVSKLVAFRQRLKPIAEKKGVKLTYLPFVVKAVVAALRQYPALNASIDDERSEIVYKKAYHVGIATDTDNGLIVPVVANADRKSMWTIAAEISDLAGKARDGKLAPHEMKGSTFSITNIGSAGGQFFTPVINWPEVAILGTGRIAEKPVVRDGALAIGQVMALSLSFDHRLIDGATAQHAMNLIKQLLSDPELLVMEV